jgi:hypothetical protein
MGITDALLRIVIEDAVRLGPQTVGSNIRTLLFTIDVLSRLFLFINLVV